MSHEQPIKAMCAVLEVSHSGYYQWRNAQTSAHALQTEAIKVKIARVHKASRHTYGSTRVTAALHEQGESVGRNRVARLMKEAGLRGLHEPSGQLLRQRHNGTVSEIPSNMN